LKNFAITKALQKSILFCHVFAAMNIEWEINDAKTILFIVEDRVTDG
jgi:hypothetical protein